MEQSASNTSATTEVGSYFVANYPPFSAWSADHLPGIERLLDTPASHDVGTTTPAGLYLHIPFCRKRCRFCYFRVYTEKNSSDVEEYLGGLAREAGLYARREALRDRDLTFVYFGGGTPSFLSSEQLQRLVDAVSEHWTWSSAREVTFECEPGTLKKGKLETIKAIGTTRLSLGIEHFDDEILELNGRAHKSPEVFRSYEWAREVGFDQINVDLIAGMLGETEAKWKNAVEQALKLQPDSLTIYQMELPHNTLISRESKESGEIAPVANWATKRAWVDYAFELFEREGYTVSSAYTVVKSSKPTTFVYRDAVWRGADMIGMGVASFSHLGGSHFQNVDSWGAYLSMLGEDKLPLARALPLTDQQRLIRETVLQLKLGHLDVAYFRSKFAVDIREVFSGAFQSMVSGGMATMDGESIRLSRDGLLRVDELLPRFFEPSFQDIRYT